ncbi:hypothetical protein [Anditalea andensis]|nr:hypothetical protein [Anditalea andensis]
MPTYIDVISQGFYQWDLSHNPGNVQSMQFYDDLAWGGLIEREVNNVMVPYEAFLDNFPDVSDQDRVKAIVANEASNGSQAKGTPCD